MRTNTYYLHLQAKISLFIGRERSISKHTLANLTLEIEVMSSSTLSNLPSVSVIDSRASPSQNSTERLCSWTHTIAFESLVVAGSKYGCHNEIWRVISLKFQGPPKMMIFCFTSSDSHRISMKPFGMSKIIIRPKSCHWPRREILTYLTAGALPKSLAYRTYWNLNLALNLVSTSTLKTSEMFSFSFSSIAPSTGSAEDSQDLDARMISAQEGVDRSPCYGGSPCLEVMECFFFFDFRLLTLKDQCYKCFRVRYLFCICCIYYSFHNVQQLVCFF